MFRTPTLVRGLALVIALAASALVVDQAQADGISATESSSFSEAFTNSTTDTDSVSTTSPSWDLSTSAAVGDSSASAGTTFASTGISFSADTDADGSQGSYGWTVSSLTFTAGTASDYIATGGFSSSGGGGDALYRVYLFNNTTSTYEFYNMQNGVAGESFSLGGTAGTINNSAIGSLTGTLTAGNSYTFYMESWVWAYPNATDPLSGSAWATLSTPVPEPGTIALLGLGLGAVAVGRRRRSAKTA